VKISEAKNVPEDPPAAEITTTLSSVPAEEKENTGFDEFLAGAGAVTPRFRRYTHRAFNTFMQECGVLLRISDTHVGFLVPL